MTNVVKVRYEKSNYDPEKIKDGKVRVGFFDSAKYDSNTYVAQIARSNEFGITVPKRPFMRPAIHERRAELVDLLRTLWKQCLKDNRNTMDALDMFGEHCKRLVYNQITHGHYKDNAPSTIKRKGKNTPLRDTLVMLNSVSYQCEEVVK